MIMRSLVSGERMMGVAGHGVLGEEGAEKVGGSLWRWPWMPDAEVESVHRGQWEISAKVHIGPVTSSRSPGGIRTQALPPSDA